MQLAQRVSESDNVSPERRSYANGRRVILACLVVGIIALGVVAVYQQSEITALSKSISQQSSELANPSIEMAIVNFTVTKANATAEPVMYLVVRNEGSAPADSGTFLVGVYGRGNVSYSCYSGNQNIFPTYSNETAMLLTQLSCGQLGDKVVLSTQVNFLTSHGSVNKVISANTTISLSQFARPQRVFVDSLGIQTYVVPWVSQQGTYYDWSLSVTNGSPNSIFSVNGTLTLGGNVVAVASGCVIIGGNNIYGVSRTTPLTPNASCSDNENLNAKAGQPSLGVHLDVSIGVKYLNGTSTIVRTSATVIPPYALTG